MMFNLYYNYIIHILRSSRTSSSSRVVAVVTAIIEIPVMDRGTHHDSTDIE